MSLRVNEPPPESRAALDLALRSASKAKSWRARLPTRLPEPVTAYPVYVLNLDSFVRGELAEATLKGWQYLIAGAGGVQLAVDIHGNEQLRRHTFAAINEGAVTENTAAGLPRAHQESRVVAGQYELRLLRIPALRVIAFWLKDEKGQDDIFMSVGPPASPLPLGGAYSWTEMKQILKRSADECVEFDAYRRP